MTVEWLKTAFPSLVMTLFLTVVGHRVVLYELSSDWAGSCQEVLVLFLDE